MQSLTPTTGSASAEILPAWQPGMLDIHQISTGRGNSALILFPDGTSLMIDAGAVSSTPQYMVAARPDTSRRPGQWIARYAQRHLSRAGRDQIDFFLLTHFHIDHMGELTADSPPSQHGDYRLTGITDVAETLPIQTLLDRGYPGYNYPLPLSDPSSLNYRRFVDARRKQGLAVDRITAGSATQIRLLSDPSKYTSCVARIVAVNGEVWSGSGSTTRQLFPPLNTITREEYPQENACSAALLLEYGSFRYFAGGDLICTTNYGRNPWQDVETPAAQAAGRVDVAVLNHHGYYDAVGPEFVRALQPRVFVLPSWHATHPALSTLDHIFAKEIYAAPRDVYATGMRPETAFVNARLSPLIDSHYGHVVVRVSPGGDQFSVFVLDDSDESDRVILHSGPYPAGQSV